MLAFSIGLAIGLAQTPNSSALSELLIGNQRFVGQLAEHPRQDEAARVALAQGQKPKAVIVTCSDSRVAPEVIFDQGLGDLFVIRCAGNSVDKLAQGSIEYAIAELKVGLVIVLGHEKCGAVKAAIEGHKLPGSIGSVVAPIKLAVASAKGKTGDRLHNTVLQHARDVARTIAGADELIRAAVKSHSVRIVSGVYDLKSGVVTILGTSAKAEPKH